MRAVQLQKLHDSQRKIGIASKKHKNIVLRCGRRWGKTTLLERMAAKIAYRGGKVGWFGPYYKINAPSYRRLAATLSPVVQNKSKIDQLIQLKTGGEVEFWTLENDDAGRSRYYDLAIIDEASLKEKGLRDIWEQAIAPTLLDKMGSAIMAGTPKGVDADNFFYEACTNKSLGWTEYHVPTHANPMLNAEAVAALEHKYPALVYQQEYLAEFVDWSGTAFFSQDKMLQDGQPVPVPEKADQVFAVIDTASKDGAQHDGTAVIYYARSKYAGIPLVILDWDVVQIEASLLINWLPGINHRLEELAKETHAREGNLGMWIEDKDSGIALLQASRRQGLPVEPISMKLTAQGKEGRAIAVSPHVHQDKVKLSSHAFNKVLDYRQQSKNHLLDQVCGFRMGQTKNEHKRDLLDCFTYGVAIALGDTEGY